MTRQNLIASLIILLVLLLSACAPAATSAPASIPPTEPPADPTGIPPTAVPPSHTPESAKTANPTLILATTTSTQDSGLLDVLVPQFQEQTGYTVQTVAVGSGQALEMGQQGNADVLLVHSPAAREAIHGRRLGQGT